MTISIPGNSILPYLDVRRTSIDIRHVVTGDLITAATIQELSRAITTRPALFEGRLNKHRVLKNVWCSLSSAKLGGLLGRRKMPPRAALSAEDNYTVFLDGATYTHHGPRSAAYARA